LIEGVLRTVAHIQLAGKRSTEANKLQTIWLLAVSFLTTILLGSD